MRRVLPSIRQYDANGRFVRMIGRRGQGPGEFRAISGFALLPDSRLIVLTVGRINVYSPQGDPIATWQINVHPPAGIGRALRVSRDGVIYLGFTRPPPARGLQAPPIGIVRIRPGGVVIDTVYAPEMPDVSLETFPVWTASARSDFQAPYSPQANWVFSPFDVIVTYRSDRYALDVQRIAPVQQTTSSTRGRAKQLLANDPVVSIRRNVPAVEVTTAERRDQRTFLQQGIPRGARHGEVTEIPRVKPFIRALRVDDEGRIWVQVSMPSERYAPPQVSSLTGAMRPGVAWREPNVWDVFESTGTYIGRLEMPDGVFPFVMRGEQVWGRWRDPTDVPFVTRYRIAWQ
jgi:hypothetical protein